VHCCFSVAKPFQFVVLLNTSLKTENWS